MTTNSNTPGCSALAAMGMILIVASVIVGVVYGWSVLLWCVTVYVVVSVVFGLLIGKFLAG